MFEECDNFNYDYMIIWNVIVSAEPSTWLKSKNSDEPFPQEPENHHHAQKYMQLLTIYGTEIF